MAPFDRKRLLAYVIILLWHLLTNAAGTNDDYNVLVRRASSLSVSEITDLADSARGAGDDRKALALYMSVCNRHESNVSENNRAASVRAWLGAGDILFDRGSYADALRMYIEGLKISDSCKSHPSAAVLYKNIGNVYCRLYDYERGTTDYKKALEVCGRHPEPLIKKKVLVNLAGVNMILGDLKSARSNYEQARVIPSGDNPELNFMDKYNYGMILVAEKKGTEALEYFRRLLAEAQKENLHPKYICSVYQQMQKAFELTERNDSSLVYIRKCLDTAKANGIEHMFLTMQLILSRHYEGIGDMRAAQECKNRYLNLKDSLLDSRQIDAVKHVQFLYEAEKVSDNINELTRQKQEREQTIGRLRVIIICVTAVALLVALFLYYIYRQKKRIDRNYRNLYSINEKYSSLQEEMRRKQIRSVKLLKEKDEEIASLKASARSEKISDIPIPDPEPQKPKYSSSNLDADRLHEIADAVSEVMDEKQAFCNPDFNLDVLSQLVGSNSKYVSQAINETYGKNFSAYINEYRVNLACQRLSDTETYGHYTVKAIGESVGFKSQSTFINVFRRMTGMTPSVYQKIAEMEKKERND